MDEDHGLAAVGPAADVDRRRDARDGDGANIEHVDALSRSRISHREGTSQAFYHAAADEARGACGCRGAQGVIDIYDYMQTLTRFTSSHCLLGPEFRNEMSEEVARIYDALERESCRSHTSTRSFRLPRSDAATKPGSGSARW